MSHCWFWHAFRSPDFLRTKKILNLPKESRSYSNNHALLILLYRQITWFSWNWNDNLPKEFHSHKYPLLVLAHRQIALFSWNWKDNLPKEFRSYREEVLFKARKLLNDKTFSVFEDMPKELYELRKAQLKKLQNAKERGDTKYFSKKYPDNLFINGKFIPLKYLLLSLICQYAKLRYVLYYYFVFSIFLSPPI